MDIDRYTVLGFFAVVVAPIVLLSSLFVSTVNFDISFKNPFASKWMKGSDIVSMAGPLKNTPMIKGLAKVLDDHNGKKFCMPRMNEDEIQAAGVSMLTNAESIAASMAPEKRQELLSYVDPKNPIEGTMLAGLIMNFPCK